MARQHWVRIDGPLSALIKWLINSWNLTNAKEFENRLHAATSPPKQTRRFFIDNATQTFQRDLQSEHSDRRHATFDLACCRPSRRKSCVNQVQRSKSVYRRRSPAFRIMAPSVCRPMPIQFCQPALRTLRKPIRRRLSRPV